MVEVLVAMAIIAILMGLGIFAIGIVQRNGRDTVRKAAIAEMEKKSADVFDQFGVNPVRISFVAASPENYVLLCADNACIKNVRLDLENAAKVNGSRFFPSNVGYSTGCCTSKEYTRYYMSFNSDGYAYAACLENKQLHYGGTSKQPIPGLIDCP